MSKDFKVDTCRIRKDEFNNARNILESSSSVSDAESKSPGVSKQKATLTKNETTCIMRGTEESNKEKFKNAKNKGTKNRQKRATKFRHR